MLNNQEPGALPRKKRLYFRSKYPFTMKDVEEMRNDLLQTSNDLLRMVDEENCLELRRAGTNISIVIDDFLDNMTEEEAVEEGGMCCPSIISSYDDACRAWMEGTDVQGVYLMLREKVKNDSALVPIASLLETLITTDDFKNSKKGGTK